MLQLEGITWVCVAKEKLEWRAESYETLTWNQSKRDMRSADATRCARGQLCREKGGKGDSIAPPKGGSKQGYCMW